jgi:transcriptional regulator with XRE-family HTH domain
MNIFSIKDIGKKITNYRKRNGLSLRGLAKVSGLNHATISRIEQGKLKFPKGSINKLSRALRLSSEERQELESAALFFPKTKIIKTTTDGVESSILARAVFILADVKAQDVVNFWIQGLNEQEQEVVIDLANNESIHMRFSDNGEFKKTKITKKTLDN